MVSCKLCFRFTEFTSDQIPLLCSWQFITLAGLHTNALISNRFAKAFAVDGMKAYATQIQEKELEEGCEVVKHQAVSCLAELLVCSGQMVDHYFFVSLVVWR